MNLRFCKNCKQIKEEFKIHKRKTLVYSDWCLDCEIDYKKQRHSERNKIYRTNNKEAKNDSNNKWRQNNNEKFNKNQREYRKNNKNKLNLQRKERNKNDILYHIKTCLRSRLNGGYKSSKIKKTKGISNSIDDRVFNHLINYLNKPCECCNKIVINDLPERNYNIDHIIPLGTGKTEIEMLSLNCCNNLRLICSTCNLKKAKHDKILIKKIRSAEKLLKEVAKLENCEIKRDFGEKWLTNKLRMVE